MSASKTSGVIATSFSFNFLVRSAMGFSFLGLEGAAGGFDYLLRGTEDE